jgi:sugar phosphate permease
MNDEPFDTSASTGGGFVRFGVLMFLGLGAASAYLTRHCIAVANTTIQDELHISESQMGWVLAAFSGGYFFFQIPGGWLGNRIGTRTAYPLISILWSALTVWSSLVWSWFPLLASRAAFGAAQAGMVPMTAEIINDWFSVRLRGMCSAVIGASMSIGGVITMGLTAWLIDSEGLGIHWRVVFRIYSVVGVVWAAFFFLFFRTRPDQHPWIPSEAADSTVSDFSEENSTEADVSEIQSGHVEEPNKLTSADLLLRIFTNKTIWGINLQSFFRAAGYGLFVTWFPAFLEYRFGMSTEEAGQMTMYPLATVIVGTLLGGVLVDVVLNITSSRLLSRSGIAFVALALCGELTLLASLTDRPGLFIILMSAGSLFAGLANPPAWAATMDVAGRYTAVIVGAMNMAGTIGGFAMPVVLGYMIGDIRKTGGDWNLVIYFVAAIYAAGAVSWLAVDPNDSAE